MTDGIRLQKVMAAAGVGSRRKCEILIEQGRVSVNGSAVDRQGTRVDPDTDVIRVDGRAIATAADLVVLALNKPKGVLSAMSDDRGRPTVGDLVAARPERLFHIGRLDVETTGLLLLTNAGELAQRVAHPSRGVVKRYRATVAGAVRPSVGQRLRRGVELEDGPAAVEDFRVRATRGDRSVVELSIRMGRNRIVRRLLAAQGHPVQELVRTSIGPVRLGGLAPGAVRRLNAREVAELYADADQP